MYRFTFIRRIVCYVFATRWLASIILLLLLDLGTFLAVRKSTGGLNLFPHMDKVLHLIGFVGLSMMGFVALSFDWIPKNRDSYFLLGVGNAIIWLIYGAGIEWVQMLLPYRDASLADFGADLIGVIFGTLLVWNLKLYPKLELKND